MKKNIFLLFLLLASLSGFSQVTTVPAIPEANQPVTITFNKAGTGLAAYSGIIYAHIGLTVNGNTWQNVIGSWGNNTLQPALSGTGNSQTLTISPDLFTYFGVSTSASITQICVVFRSATGAQQSTDFFLNVGAFQANLTAPALNSTTIINSGQNLNITGNNSNGSASYNLFANGVSIYTSSGATFAYNDTNITTNKNYDLQITQGATTFSRKFSVMINPGTISAALPSAALRGGINYNPTDATKATLVLDAPGKDFVYVAGSFNNYNPTAAYAMRKDNAAGSTKFWLELTGLTPGQIYHYQYWVVDAVPNVPNTPVLVKTADPYSTLVLNTYDDPYIPAATYPNLPVYPLGQSREVTVLQTGQTPYNWQVTNFAKPKKEDLIVYEVLVRDFDANRNFQDLINKIDYFKNLNVNAIELMPVMEFEGNESWGYNTSFHMALDKFYGTENKFKEFIDLCHQNGIAVILDVALNHAFGRNPMNRMWMLDADGDGWGEPSSENPYFNQVATHSYGVGSDFNHQQPRTQEYVRRVIEHWIKDFKIDGFRWDLTKGFTQNCTGDEGCTGSYQADRVAVLKSYADYSWFGQNSPAPGAWNGDPTHYAIFEHLGQDAEEKEWANWHLTGDADGISKGVMMWSEQTYPYTQLIEGYATGGDISRIGHNAHAGFLGKRVMGYPESHDKDRLMYGAMTYGNSAGTTPLNNLNNSLARMSAIGATSLLVPGPKMIWHFADLGMQNSIYTCSDGTVNTETDPTTGDCKLSTKPQPQWTQNWLANANRNKIYNDWAKMIALKIQEPVFEGNYSISTNGSNVRQRIYIYDDALPATQLKNVVVLANFSVAAQNITPDFPYPGTWYNLMDNTSVVVTNTATPINIAAGQAVIYGNKQVTLNTDQFETSDGISLYPNPSSEYFTVNVNVTRLEIYSLSGQLVKSFGKQSDRYQYNIGELTNGLYLVKATDASNREKTMKLIKQ